MKLSTTTDYRRALPARCLNFSAVHSVKPFCGLRMLVLLAIFGLNFPPLLAAPVLQFETRTLEPKSKLDIHFDNPMVKPEQINQVETRNLIQITPAIEHQLVWQSQQKATLSFTATPELATEYEFTTVAGLEDLEGRPIPAMAPIALTTKGFARPKSRRLSIELQDNRLPTVLLEFVTATAPDQLAKAIYFIDDEKRKIAAKVEQPTLGQVMQTLNRWQRIEQLVSPAWEEQLINAEDAGAYYRDPQRKLKHCAMVTPSSPLPIGQNWRLIIPPQTWTERDPSKLQTASVGVGNVDPLLPLAVDALVPLNVQRSISIEFNYSIDHYTSKQLSQLITLHPALPGANYEIDSNVVRITGQILPKSAYSVYFSDKLKTTNQLPLAKTEPKRIEFTPITPQLSLPGNHENLLATGNRAYAFTAINMADFRLRIKSIPAAQLPLALQAYRHYHGSGPHREEVINGTALPYELFPGEEILDQSQTLDTDYDESKIVPIDWNKITGASDSRGVFFVELTGRSKDGQRRLTQAVVQLTDLGLAWKFSDLEALIYVYSCATGRPISDAKIKLFGSQGRELGTYRTSTTGTVTLPRQAANYYFTAHHGQDTTIAAFGEELNALPMWRFPVATSWYPQPEVSRKVYLFTDRTLYQPGETVHLKGIVRQLRGNLIEFPEQTSATLTLYNPRNQPLFSETIDFSELATFDQSFTLPESSVGHHRFTLIFPRAEDEPEPKGWAEQYVDEQNRIFTHTFRVNEFRRNAFEILSNPRKPEPGDTTWQVQLNANYYQGEAVANGQVTWFQNSSEAGFFPDNYRDFYFGDHREYNPRYWQHYFGYNQDRYWDQRRDSENGSLQLDADGTATIELELPQYEFPQPMRTQLSLSITDARNQTLSHSLTTLTHPVDTYLGIQRLDRIAKVGDAIDLSLVAITHQGQPSAISHQLEAKIERFWNEKSIVEAPDRRSNVINEQKSEIVSTQQLELLAGQDNALTFTPQHSGEHIITLSSIDRAGRTITTAVKIHVYGDDSYPWAYDSSMRIKLVPEKPSYLPGDTARVLVQTPIEGTALVTVEREQVLRHFITELKMDSPMIEVPLDAIAAPNAYISVLVIRGADASKRQHPEPALKLGYCEVKVTPTEQQLALNLDPPGGSLRPGAQVTLSGQLRDANNQPVANAEVTLYAEDEGVLSVAGYPNPDPFSHFYAPRLLSTKAGASLDDFLSEDPASRYYGNKGFFIGGGGDDIPIPNIAQRTRFAPCALWHPTLRTDSQGHFSTSFQAPDTLTRYRVIAVAVAGPQRFTTTTSELLINQPIMLEGMEPRFAAEGDQINLKTILLNTSETSGIWQVTLNANELISFPDSQSNSISKQVKLAAGTSTEIEFTANLVDTGEATLTWSAAPIELTAQSLSPSIQAEFSDAYQASFPVTYPTPLLRERKVAMLTPEHGPHQILATLNPELLQDRGDITLHFSNNQLVRANGAGEYLLRYPYGCLEQTSSAMLPWLALQPLRSHLPALAHYSSAEQIKALNLGVMRILNAQNSLGGFGYWPNSNQPNHWASSFATLVLLLAKEQGADVPAAALDKATGYLATTLKDGDSSPWHYSHRARTLWALALAGQPDFAYQNNLLEMPELLGPSGRAFLAMALTESKAPDAKQNATQLLTSTYPNKKENHWMSYRPNTAIQLLAAIRCGLDADHIEKYTDRLLGEMNAAGHWHHTWGNGWAMLALAAYATQCEATPSDSTVVLTINQQPQTIQLSADHPTYSITIPLTQLDTLDVASTKGPLVVITELAAKPPLTLNPARVGSTGLTISREYHLVLNNGELVPLTEPKVGDLICVTLTCTADQPESYLAIEDRLPSIFETVNQNFATQAAPGIREHHNNWRVSRRELRADRALFFVNRVTNRGSTQCHYFARVTRAGSASAPPAKLEPMYNLEATALSAQQRLISEYR